MKKTDYIRKVEAIVEKTLNKSKKQSLAHDFSHFNRVRLNALAIAENYSDVDTEVLQLAALLHDIDQPYNKKIEHVARSMNKAKKILTDINYEKTSKVLDLIKRHSTENIYEKNNIESKILFDADKIDGLGVIGAARVFLYCGQNNMRLRNAIEWYEKKIGIALNNLQTPEGRKMTEEKIAFTKKFLTELKKEVE